MRNKFLLGATNDDELVFGEFELRNREYGLEFSASFDTVRPFKAEDYDLVEYYEEWMYGMDKEYLYDQCERLDCSPSELAQELADECYDVRDALDCSLYSEEVYVDDESWCFESSACGQHDTREVGMKEYVNEEAYNLLHTLWDNYHLKQVDEEVIKQVEKIIDMLSDVDEEQWIIEYIENNLD